MANALLDMFTQGKEYLDSLEDPEEKRRREFKEAGPQINPLFEEDAGMNQSPALQDQSGETEGDYGYVPPWELEAEREDDALFYGRPDRPADDAPQEDWREFYEGLRENRHVAPWVQPQGIKKHGMHVLERLLYGDKGDNVTDKDWTDLGRIVDLQRKSSGGEPMDAEGRILSMPPEERRQFLNMMNEMHNRSKRLKPGGMMLGA